MNEDLIAPCGMNCALCAAYQFRLHDLNKKGFHRKYCPGCIPRGQNCLHMGDVCEQLAQGTLRFCFECAVYPCKRLKALDKRYRSKYHMSMIANLNQIRDQGLESLLAQEAQKWVCPTCGGYLCCHNGLCMHCQADDLRGNPKYRWNEE